MTVYRVSLGRVLPPFVGWEGGLTLDLVDWTESIVIEDDVDSVWETVRSVLAANPEYTRASVLPVRLGTVRPGVAAARRGGARHGPT